VSEPDLFVVCKNCSSEVSPYVTECPYCGQRVRKRAPKIERSTGEAGAPRRRRPRAPTLPRLRRGEIPGIAPEARPYGTIALVVAALGVTIAHATNSVSFDQLGAVTGPIGHQWWRLVTTAFVFNNAGTEFVTLVAVAIFGTLIERRFGLLAAVATFLLCGTAGAALSVGLHVYPAISANGAALGLLTAWLVDDRLAARRGDDRGNDLIGVWVFATLLLLIPLGDTDTSFFAGLGGAAAGAAIGAAISPLRP
jgi:membrane associated rhomboid family serine protease